MREWGGGHIKRQRQRRSSGQINPGFAGHCKDFDFHPEVDGKPLEIESIHQFILNYVQFDCMPVSECWAFNNQQDFVCVGTRAGGRVLGGWNKRSRITKKLDQMGGRLLSAGSGHLKGRDPISQGPSQFSSKSLFKIICYNVIFEYIIPTQESSFLF